MNVMASNNSLHMSGSLRPNLESESILELQKILTDERKRSAEHKLNYQQIKSELSRLQENYARVESELALCVETRKKDNEDNRKKLTQATSKLFEAQKDIDDLKVNQVTEKRIEIIRLKIEEQFESVYQERFAQASAECDAMRSEMGRLRTENAFLKAEYEHQLKEHGRIIEEMNLIHQAEVSALKSEKARILASNFEIPQEFGSLKEMCKENNVLRSQMKSMLNELQESRNKLEHERSSSEQELRAKKKQLTETTSSCRKMELELNSLKEQLDNSQKEVSSWTVENANLQFKSNELDRTNRMLQNRLDELTQKAKVDLTQLKMESARQRGEIERQKDLLSAKIDELEYQLRLAGTKCGQLESQLQEREVSIARREAAIKETEWARMQQLESDKMELEHRVESLQSMLREEKNSIAPKLANLEERAHKAEQKEIITDKEKESLKLKLESMSNDLKAAKASLNDTHNKMVQQEAELDECYNRLAVSELAKQERNEFQQQVRNLEKQIGKASEEHKRTLMDNESQWSEERDKYRVGIKKLEDDLNKNIEKSRVLQEELRRKNKKHGTYFGRQKKQLQIAMALREEAQAENEILKRNVPAEDVQKLTRELKDLRRRHNEYRAIIMHSTSQLSLSGCGGGGGSGEPSALTDQQEARYEQSLRQLKKRLELLDQKQQQQLPEVLHMHETEKGDPEKPDSSYGPSGDNL